MNRASAYAHAYLNLYEKELNRASIEAIDQAAHFLHEHRRALFLLKVPVMGEAVKRDGMRELQKRFQLPNSILNLFDLLLHNGVAGLLAAIFSCIVHEYYKRNSIEQIRIISSYDLSESEKKEWKAFADARFPGEKEYRFEVDTRLIAGIKIMSDTMLWESSIERYLRECTQAQI